MGIEECLPNDPDFAEVDSEESRQPNPKLLGHWQSSIDYASATCGVGAGVSRAASLRAALASCMTRSDAVLQEELRLGQPTSDYGHQVLALSKSLRAHEGAWGDLEKYLQMRETCYGARVTTLIGDAAVRKWSDLGKHMLRWKNEDKLKDAYNLLRALKHASEEINCFEHEHAVLLEMVATDGLESRSWWDSMGAAITNAGGSLGHAEDLSIDGVNMQKDTRFVLGDVFQEGFLNMASLVDLRLHEHTDIIAPICHRAKMQRALELELEAMCAAWESPDLAWLKLQNLPPTPAQVPWQFATGASSPEKIQELTPVVCPHSVIVELTQTSVDKVETIIEEQLTNVKLLQGSPFVGPHLRRCYQWEARLDQAEIVLLEWCELQRTMDKVRKKAGLAMFGASERQCSTKGLAPVRQHNIGKTFADLDVDFMAMQIEVRDMEVVVDSSAITAIGPTGVPLDQTDAGVEVDRDAIGRTILAPSLFALGGIITCKRLSELKSRLEFVKRKLRTEVEGRCGAFPRLWLLSKDQIFKLLVDSRSRTEVQRHLPFLFPGMSGIMFGSGEEDDASTAGYIDAGDITAIYCDDGEIIGLAKRSAGELEGFRQHLHKMLSPDIIADELTFNKVLHDRAYINPERHRSPIELWLRQLETEMRRAVAEQIDGAVRAWPTLKMAVQAAERVRKKRLEQEQGAADQHATGQPASEIEIPTVVSKEATFKWIRRWPIQAVRVACETHWTQNVARALRAGEENVKRELQGVLEKHRHRMGYLVEGVLQSHTASIPLTQPGKRAKQRRHLAKMTTSLMCSRHQEDIMIQMIGDDMGSTGATLSSTSTPIMRSGEHSETSRRVVKLAAIERTSSMRNFQRTPSATALSRDDTKKRDGRQSELSADSNDDLTFFWLAQVRHGFRKSASKKRNTPGTASIRVFNVSLDHGGEVFGARTMRQLVIMPLTERCYRSVLLSVAPTGAHGGSGAVLKGPSGIGKTETLRQLAQECGVCCPLVNGSDQIATPDGIVRLVRAIAGIGSAWLLLDNVARIPMAVLSVLGHSLTSLRRALVTGISLAPGAPGGYQDATALEAIGVQNDSISMHANHTREHQIYLSQETMTQNGILPDFFDFNGCKSIIRPGGCVVATFDFDHEERSEKARRQLPENLALFFRPCTILSVPGDNLALVAEVMLMTGGFEESHNVAKRLCTLHTCAEQLLGGAGRGEEHQQHYGFTFMSLVSVLRLSCVLLRQSGMMKGRLEGARFYNSTTGSSSSGNEAAAELGSIPEDDEQSMSKNLTSIFLQERQIVASAWTQVHDPMFTDMLDRRRARHLVDELLLHTSSSENKVTFHQEASKEQNLIGARYRQQLSRPEARVLERICHHSYVAPEPSFLSTVCDLRNNLDSWNAALVLGAPHTGKSCAIKLLANALPLLTEAQLNTRPVGLGRGSQTVTSIAPYVLNPMALTLTALFGTGDTPRDDNDACGGLLRHTLLRCCESAREYPQEQQWLIFDGPVDSSWIDGMNTMFGSSRALCLPTGESIPIPRSTKLIFETCSISDATPGVISRMGVVSIGDAVLSWRSMLNIWVDSFEARSTLRHGGEEPCERSTDSTKSQDKTALRHTQKTRERRRGSVASIGHINLPGEAGAGNHESKAVGQLSTKAVSDDAPQVSPVSEFRPGSHISKLFDAWLEPCVGLMSPGGALSMHLFGDADTVDALSFARCILHVLDILLDPSLNSLSSIHGDDYDAEERRASH